MSKNILIAGGSGLLGQVLTDQLLSAGYAVGWLSRKPLQSDRIKGFRWDPQHQEIDPAAIQWADAIVHLAGEPIAGGRWTRRRKELIINSRTQTSALLQNALSQYPNKVQTVVAASAVGYYGNTKGPAKETDEPGTGFLSESVCAWEKATDGFQHKSYRFVRFRIGIVLSKKGGAYPELIQAHKLRVLAIPGNGNAHYAWIHIDDMTGILQYALEKNISGTYNAVAPEPASISTIMKTIAKVKGGWYFIPPVPAFALRIVFGEMADAVLIDQNISAEKLLSAGYAFEFADIKNAITSIENDGR